VYNACATFTEALTLGATLVDGGYMQSVVCATSSHFSSAERQYRYPLELGCTRPPQSQWTVTGAGAVVLTAEGAGPYITHVTAGKIVDAGITDANNMGAAMAPAAYDTIKTHFEDTGRNPDYYDAIVTGDLGAVGHGIVKELFRKDGIELGPLYIDCGMLIYNTEAQDVHAGGSGCGCSAAVLCGHLLHNMTENRWPRLLFCGTGALMSPTSSQQGESIPGICHAVALEMQRGC